MYMEQKKVEFPKKYNIWIWTQKGWEVDHEKWQDEVRDNGRLVGGNEWKERVYNQEEWKKLLRTATNRCILYMPIEWLTDWLNEWKKMIVIQVMYKFAPLNLTGDKSTHTPFS
jgi:hypothetical protein